MHAGKGAFGVVKLAISKKTGTKDAVKSISKAKLVCKEDVKDVQAEVAIMNLVAGHPHVVSLKSTHEDKDFVHLAMELCAGGELFDSIVEAGNFSEKKAAKVRAALFLSRNNTSLTCANNHLPCFYMRTGCGAIHLLIHNLMHVCIHV
eukprot:1144021-Pelagomonas_calceolata.AAC.1